VTDVALKEYLERRIDDADRRYEQRFHAAEVALNKAEAALRDYKVGSNEWRDALKDQAARMATRDELEKLEADVQELRRARSNLDGKLLVIAAIVSAGTGVIVSIIAQAMVP
jgi:hypothetical protein